MNQFNKYPKLKKTSFFLFLLVGGGGWGEEVASISEFFVTKNPNLKKEYFFWLEGGGVGMGFKFKIIFFFFGREGGRRRGGGLE